MAKKVTVVTPVQNAEHAPVARDWFASVLPNIARSYFFNFYAMMVCVQVGYGWGLDIFRVPPGVFVRCVDVPHKEQAHHGWLFEAVPGGTAF
jgi:hypothetical protein